jgi:hypothetical protein
MQWSGDRKKFSRDLLSNVIWRDEGNTGNSRVTCKRFVFAGIADDEKFLWSAHLHFRNWISFAFP